MDALRTAAQASRRVAREVVARPAGARPHSYHEVPDDCPLTARQREIVRLAMRGLSYGEIARELVLAESTVCTHMWAARAALGITGRGRGHLFALMLARGWAIADDLLPDYRGAPYARAAVRGLPRAWVPSPAWRLYLDAFDRLLVTRSASAAADVAYFLGVVCRAEGVSVPERGKDVDAMLRRVGARICTPEQKRLLRYF